MTISIRAMHYFNTALSHGSIAHAAEELNIAASAISTAIDKIEAEFQLNLVNRFRSKGIAATASGKIMQRKFARILEEFEAVMIEGSELKKALKGELKIGYYAPVAPAFLPSILKSLTGSEFLTDFHLDECDNNRAQEGYLAGDFDAILFVSDGALPQIEFDVLLEAPAYCLVSAQDPLSKKKAVELEELAERSLIVLNKPVAADYYRRILKQTESTSTPLIYSNSTEMVRSLVGAGHGVAVLNMTPLTATSYAGDQLVALPISDPLPPLTLALGYDKSRPRRIVSHFAEQCKRYFERFGAEAHIVTPEHKK